MRLFESLRMNLGGEVVNTRMQWEKLGQKSHPCVWQPRAGNQCGKWDSSDCAQGRSRHLYLCTERKAREQGAAQ